MPFMEPDAVFWGVGIMVKTREYRGQPHPNQTPTVQCAANTASAAPSAGLEAAGGLPKRRHLSPSFGE